MRTGLYLLLIGCGFVFPSANATELTIPGHAETMSKQLMPKRGISMEKVLAKFGEPDERFGPVGEPPISEWVYGSFRVYFEYRTVLHSIDLNTLVMPK
ncbi:MAG: hypothetical protein ACI9LO_001881 [Planctomycetota bacterium]|jgi:hypothetical protein